jgi:hypothetical protein
MGAKPNQLVQASEAAAVVVGSRSESTVKQLPPLHMPVNDSVGIKTKVTEAAVGKTTTKSSSTNTAAVSGESSSKVKGDSSPKASASDFLDFLNNDNSVDVGMKIACAIKFIKQHRGEPQIISVIANSIKLIKYHRAELEVERIIAVIETGFNLKEDSDAFINKILMTKVDDKRGFELRSVLTDEDKEIIKEVVESLKGNKLWGINNAKVNLIHAIEHHKHNTIKMAAQAVLNEIDKVSPTANMRELRVLTQVIKGTTHALSSPNSYNLTQYTQLISQVPGQRKTGKQLAAAMIMFAGMVFLGTSAGLAIGLSVLSVGAFAPLCTMIAGVGGALFYAGVKYAYDNSEQSLPRSMKFFKQKLEAHQLPPPSPRNSISKRIVR